MARAAGSAGALLVASGVWAAADPAAQGKQIALQGTASGVPACTSCHGARGEGAAAFPRLAGTGRLYLREQLDAFASGARQNATMQPFAQKLTPDERAAVTAYFAGLPAPVTAADPVTVTPAEAGAWLATRGRWGDQIPACAQCHGPAGRGVGPNFPPLAGQPAEYLTAQLKAWQAGTRAPGPLALMQGVAKRLGDGDIRAVAAYYAGLGAPAAQAASSAREHKR